MKHWKSFILPGLLILLEIYTVTKATDLEYLLFMWTLAGVVLLINSFFDLFKLTSRGAVVEQMVINRQTPNAVEDTIFKFRNVKTSVRLFYLAFALVNGLAYWYIVSKLY